MAASMFVAQLALPGPAHARTTVGAWTPLELNDTSTHSLMVLCATKGTGRVCGGESSAVSGSGPVLT